jgi:hypothetical protein
VRSLTIPTKSVRTPKTPHSSINRRLIDMTA